VDGEAAVLGKAGSRHQAADGVRHVIEFRQAGSGSNTVLLRGGNSQRAVAGFEDDAYYFVSRRRWQEFCACPC
jgi:hypothetical protein